MFNISAYKTVGFNKLQFQASILLQTATSVQELNYLILQSKTKKFFAWCLGKIFCYKIEIEIEKSGGFYFLRMCPNASFVI